MEAIINRPAKHTPTAMATVNIKQMILTLKHQLN